MSKHHYAVTLSRMGHDILFFGPPERRRTAVTIEPVERAGATLGLVRSDRVGKGLAYLPAVLRQHLERRWLEALERVAGRRIDVVWLFENSRFFDMRFAGNRAKIYHQVDPNQDFHPTEAAATADLSIGNCSPIERLIRPFAKNFLRLGHGLARGTEQPLADTLLDERFCAGRRHAVLIGNLDLPHLDVDLIVAVVGDHAEVCFHLVGSYSSNGRLFSALGKAPNVLWWGRQPAEALPSILRRADLLLLAYLGGRYRDQASNSHKILEYLASGRPVLATYTDEFADSPDLIAMATDEADFRAKFAALIADGETLGDEVSSARRMHYAGERTYEARIAKITTTLDGAFAGRNPLRMGTS